MKTYLWQITAKTNLHVGNENSTSYGIIDKAVQRDVLTGLPCINSSSLKGAINEYCCSVGMQEQERKDIFGSDKKGNKSDSKKGQAIFYDSHILYLPVQDDVNLYRYVTSDSVFAQLKTRLDMFGIECKNLMNTFKLEKEHSIESIDPKRFILYCNDENLPIIARNVLEGGESKNLWYEQVVPAETVFYTIIQEPSDILKNTINGNFIQIGANATIGYGYCRFDLIAEYDENEGEK